MRISIAICAVAVCLSACEDGPKSIFQPNNGDPAVQNGHRPGESWTQGGEKAFESTTADDSEGRARFCDETLTQELIEWMVTQPLIPDVSSGGIPLWTEDGAPLHVDSLLGVPNPRNEDGTWSPGLFCDPWYTYSNALTWGPLDDIIVFFEPETRLVSGIDVGGQYLGTLAGDTTVEGAPTNVELVLFEEMKIGGQELQTYPEWASPEVVTAVYGMIRESFFGGEALPADFNCVEAKLCDVIYPLGDPATPQPTYIIFQDSGVMIGFSEDGNLQFVSLEPVRIAPLEVSAHIQFGEAGLLNPTLISQNALLPECTPNLSGNVTWEGFSSTCANEMTLGRVNYEVSTQRDSVDANFNGVTFSFLRPTTVRGVLADGARPAGLDRLYGIGFGRALNATVAEYVPHDLAVTYAQKLGDKLRAALKPEAALEHPFANYLAPIPYAEDGVTPLLPTVASRIGELMYEGKSWVPEVLEHVKATYEALSPEDRAMINPGIIEDIFLIEPFVDTVLSNLTHGASDGAGAYKAFRTSDTFRWSIGRAHFNQGDTRYRLMVQYSLYYGAVTYITVEEGYSETDGLLNATSEWVSHAMGMPAPVSHYELWMSQVEGNPYGLGGAGISVLDFDRRLGMVEVTAVDAATYYSDAPEAMAMTVAGEHAVDNAGYTRQIQGERYEFVPAHEVYLYGKESHLKFFIEGDGTIGKVIQPMFKGSLELCSGLGIAYGDPIREKVIAWEALVGAEAARDCEVVYNYSENGNVLDSVASLRGKMAFTTIGGRAVTASIWR